MQNTTNTARIRARNRGRTALLATVILAFLGLLVVPAASAQTAGDWGIRAVPQPAVNGSVRVDYVLEVAPGADNLIAMQLEVVWNPADFTLTTVDLGAAGASRIESGQAFIALFTTGTTSLGDQSRIVSLDLEIGAGNPAAPNVGIAVEAANTPSQRDVSPYVSAPALGSVPDAGPQLYTIESVRYGTLLAEQDRQRIRLANDGNVQWELRDIGNGRVHIVNAATGNWIDGDGYRRLLDTSTSPAADDEWTMKQLGNGNWVITSVKHNVNFDADGNSTVGLRRDENSDAQWIVAPVGAQPPSAPTSPAQDTEPTGSFVIESVRYGTALAEQPGKNIRLASSGDMVWNIVPIGNGRVHIINETTGNWIDGDGYRQRLDTSTSPAADDEWTMKKLPAGTWVITNVKHNVNMDADGNSTVGLRRDENDDAQWRLLPQGGNASVLPLVGLAAPGDSGTSEPGVHLAALRVAALTILGFLALALAVDVRNRRGALRSAEWSRHSAPVGDSGSAGATDRRWRPVVALTAVALFATATFAGPVSAQPVGSATETYGDVNCKDGLNILDAFHVAQFSVGLRTAVSSCEGFNPNVHFRADLADMNDDGRAGIFDAYMVARCSVRLPLDACKPRIVGAVSTSEVDGDLAGIEVCAKNVAAPADQVCDQTNSDGAWTLLAVPASDLEVSVQDPTGMLATNCSPIPWDCREDYAVVLGEGKSLVGMELTLASADPLPPEIDYDAVAGISGTVTESASGGALVGVNVCATDVVELTEVCTTSGPDGTYTLSNVAGGDHWVSFNHSNHSPGQVQVTLAAPAPLTDVDIALVRLPPPPTSVPIVVETTVYENARPQWMDIASLKVNNPFVHPTTLKYSVDLHWGVNMRADGSDFDPTWHDLNRINFSVLGEPDVITHFEVTVVGGETFIVPNSYPGPSADAYVGATRPFAGGTIPSWIRLTELDGDVEVEVVIVDETGLKSEPLRATIFGPERAEDTTSDVPDEPTEYPIIREETVVNGGALDNRCIDAGDPPFVQHVESIEIEYSGTDSATVNWRDVVGTDNNFGLDYDFVIYSGGEEVERGQTSHWGTTFEFIDEQSFIIEVVATDYCGQVTTSSFQKFVPYPVPVFTESFRLAPTDDRRGLRWTRSGIEVPQVIVANSSEAELIGGVSEFRIYEVFRTASGWGFDDTRPVAVVDASDGADRTYSARFNSTGGIYALVASNEFGSSRPTLYGLNVSDVGEFLLFPSATVAGLESGVFDLMVDTVPGIECVPIFKVIGPDGLQNPELSPEEEFQLTECGLNGVEKLLKSSSKEVVRTAAKRLGGLLVLYGLVGNAEAFHQGYIEGRDAVILANGERLAIRMAVVDRVLLEACDQPGFDCDQYLGSN